MCLQILRTYSERIFTDILWVRNLGQFGTHTHTNGFAMDSNSNPERLGHATNGTLFLERMVLWPPRRHFLYCVVCSDLRL